MCVTPNVKTTVRNIDFGKPFYIPDRNPFVKKPKGLHLRLTQTQNP